MKEKVNALVLGVGGNVSQGILKALNLSSLPCRVIGACISPLSMGLYTVDHAYVSPAANDPAFFEWLIRTCQAEHVDVILSGVEPVLSVLSSRSDEIRRLCGAFTVVSKPDILSLGNDKLLTCEWLRKNGLNYPKYAESSDPVALQALATECRYPLLAKPRGGKGGYGISLVRNERDLQTWLQRSGYVIQEYLGDETTEFTVGCFSDRNGQVRGAITMWRELLQGTTYKAVVGNFPEIRDEAIRIASALKPLGPCNVQLRMTANGPVCFEINVRFSGTTALRARFGFNDVEAAIRHYVLNEPAVDLPRVSQGVALRYWNEAYIDVNAQALLEKTGALPCPAQYSSRIEDYGVKSS